LTYCCGKTEKRSIGDHRTYTKTGRLDELEMVGNEGWTLRKTCCYPGAMEYSCVVLKREGYINHLRVDVP
jgi:hypothetical protein